jgi:hypothetical protein
MKCKLSLYIGSILYLIAHSYCNAQQLYSIPQQTIQPAKILGPLQSQFGSYEGNNLSESLTLDVGDFQMSSLVTCQEYKEYLQVIKRDSSRRFYLSQLPDSTMCLPDVYSKYIAGNQYDEYPIMAISWDAAMNYCRWKTMENNKDSIKYIYRIPSLFEWLAAYSYLNNTSVKNDLSKNYSDWLLNPIDGFIPDKSYGGSYKYLSNKNEPNVLKRKMVIGDSYLYKLGTLYDYLTISYFSFEGSRQVGFRYTKRKIERKKGNEQSDDLLILKDWGLK